MKYTEALEHLDALGRKLAALSNSTVLGADGGWRLFMRPIEESHTCQAELQHREERHWFSVASVSVSTAFEGGALSLRTYINCTMCGRWRDERDRARGLTELFKIAVAFEEYTAGKIFES